MGIYGKTFGAGLLVGLLLCLCACGQGASEAPSAPTVSPYMEPAPETPVSQVLHVFSPSPSPVPSPTPSPSPTPTPEPTPEPEPTPFTLCWFSDTQVYTYRYPEVFCSMTEYALENRESKNILAILHTGDIVDSYSGERQWNNAAEAVGRLEGKVPFYCVSGNHDVGGGGNHYEENYFPRALCDVREPDRLYEGGKCWYTVLEAGGEKFLILGLGWLRASDDGFISWAREVLDSHSDHIAILITHSYIGHEAAFSERGKRIEKELVRLCPNVRLILCGHYHSAARLTKTYEAGHTVTALLCDFQADEENGLGFFRLLTFDPADRSIQVSTYSPYLNSDRYKYWDESENAFTLENAW